MVSVKVVKYGRGFYPTHGKGEQEGHQIRLSGHRRQGTSKFWHIFRVDPDSIKPIGDIDFRHAHWSIPGISADNRCIYLLQCLSKLLCFTQGQRNRLLLADVRNGKLENQPGAPITLRHISQWR